MIIFPHLSLSATQTLIGFPGGSAVNNPPIMQETEETRFPSLDQEDPWPGTIPWRGHGNSLQYSCPENPMKRKAWGTTVHGVLKRVECGWARTHSDPFHPISCGLKVLVSLCLPMDSCCLQDAWFPWFPDTCPLPPFLQYLPAVTVWLYDIVLITLSYRRSWIYIVFFLKLKSNK